MQYSDIFFASFLKKMAIHFFSRRAILPRGTRPSRVAFASSPCVDRARACARGAPPLPPSRRALERPRPPDRPPRPPISCPRAAQGAGASSPTVGGGQGAPHRGPGSARPGLCNEFLVCCSRPKLARSPSCRQQPLEQRRSGGGHPPQGPCTGRGNRSSNHSQRLRDSEITRSPRRRLGKT